MFHLNWQITTLLPGLAAALAFSVFTIKRKSLSPDGALAASLLGLSVLVCVSAKYLLPLFFFFISSVLLGRLAKRRSIVSDVKHGKARDYRQVLCNGGIYGALAILFAFNGLQWLLALMAVSIAVSTADTWSSEIGMYCRGRTFDILRTKSVPPGLSGGVSVQGTAGGLAGAFCVAVLCSYVMAGAFIPVFILLVTAAGFGGMILDSLLGAGLQARYRDPSTGALSDIISPGAVLHSGWSWMSNDAVNFWSNALTTAGSLVCAHFMYN